MNTPEEMLKKAQTLSLDQVFKRAVSPSSTNLDLLKREYQRFLVLAFIASNSSEKFPCRPPPMIDDVWHAHILFTRQYESDCKLVGGHFLHHTPEIVRNEDKEQHFHDGVYLLKKYREYFNEDAPTVIWPTPVKPQDPNEQIYDSWCGRSCG